MVCCASLVSLCCRCVAHEMLTACPKWFPKASLAPAPDLRRRPPAPALGAPPPGPSLEVAEAAPEDERGSQSAPPLLDVLIERRDGGHRGLPTVRHVGPRALGLVKSGWCAQMHTSSMCAVVYTDIIFGLESQNCEHQWGIDGNGNR